MQINLHLIKFKWSSKHILREGRVGFKLGKLSQGLIETKRQQLEAPRTFQRMVLLQSASRKLNLHVASSQLLSSGLQLCFSCPSFLSPLCFQPDPEDKLKGIPPSPWSRELGELGWGPLGWVFGFRFYLTFLVPSELQNQETSSSQCLDLDSDTLLPLLAHVDQGVHATYA